MSYFAVQVRSGSEIEVKKMLQDVLSRKGNQMIEAIYALESYSETINEKTNHFDLTALTSTDIDDHLFIQRLQTNASNLRAAFDQLEPYNDDKSITLKKEYQKEIKHITAKMKSIRDTTRKISSVLKGYILVEVEQTLDYLPNHLWHLVKSIPKVIGIPSKMNIPQDEVDAFFEEVEMSDEVEMQLDEVLAFEHEKQEEEKLIQQLNQNPAKEKQEMISQQLDDMNTDIEQEVQQTTSNVAHITKRVKAFIKNNRKTVTLPATVFKQLYHDIVRKGAIPTQIKSSSIFLCRLQQWLQQRQAVLE